MIHVVVVRQYDHLELHILLVRACTTTKCRAHDKSAGDAADAAAVESWESAFWTVESDLDEVFGGHEPEFILLLLSLRMAPGCKAKLANNHGWNPEWK